VSLPRRILLTILSGGTAMLAFPPFSYWPLAFAAWPLLFLAIRGAGRSTRLIGRAASTSNTPNSSATGLWKTAAGSPCSRRPA